ncbi:site-specific integrase [Candidatus Bathyarchaeota archaeon]|nr:site-specific integrase [Candidatus Bathyarchaeota archaeon]
MGRLDYLSQFSSKSTVASYRSALKKFFQTVFDEPVKDLDVAAEKYFSEARDHAKCVEAFMVAMKAAPPKTRKAYLTAVRIFLLENEVELPQRFWRRLRGRIKGSRPVSTEKIPTREELRGIMQHLPLHGRALYLTLLSSGMRIGEALKIKIQDVELDKMPAVVHIRSEYTKTGNPRITFISEEAKETLKEWLRVRDRYLKAAAGKSHLHDKSVEDDRLFPFTAMNARAMWSNALEKTGNGKRDPRTGRLVIRPHVLRKYFRATLGKYSIDLTEALMGHEGYLTEVYRKYPNPEKELGEFYKKHMHELCVFDASGLEDIKIEQKVNEKVAVLRKTLEDVMAENLMLKRRVQELEDAVAEIKRRLLQRLEELEKKEA